MNSRGYAICARRWARLAADLDEPRVGVIAGAVAAAVTVAVHGRAGVGRGTVARALTAAGVQVSSGGAHIDVHVVAEVVKPEDQVAIAASSRPVLVVLNKADLFINDVAGAAGRCARLAAMTGAPTVPLVAHLGIAQVDDQVLAALRTLAETPCDLGSTDGFVTASHPLPVPTRRRLLGTLDLLGIAHGIGAVRDRPGADPATVQQQLRRCSGIGAVVAALDSLVAEIGYGRLRAATVQLEALAATAGPELARRIGDFLRDDDTVVARMAAAVDVVQAAGVRVDPGDSAAAHLCRAAHWQRYGGGPVNAVHRACGHDIARGSMRLWRATFAGRPT